MPSPQAQHPAFFDRGNVGVPTRPAVGVAHKASDHPRRSARQHTSGSLRDIDPTSIAGLPVSLNPIEEKSTLEVCVCNRVSAAIALSQEAVDSAGPETIDPGLDGGLTATKIIGNLLSTDAFHRQFDGEHTFALPATSFAFEAGEKFRASV